MSAALYSISLAGDWDPLLSRLKGWRQREPHVWQGSGALLTTHAQGANAAIATPAALIRVFSDKSWNIEDQRQPLATRPQDLTLPTLNHIAIDIGHDGGNIVDLVAREECATFLPRESRHDPSIGRAVIAEHVVHNHDLYLTARFGETSGPTRLAHVGWEVGARDDIDRIVDDLNRIEWPIVYGPDRVDESYLVHFTGPDEAVHDFFFVERAR